MNEDDIVELTENIVSDVEELADVVEWKEKISIQKEMRQQVQIQLIKADLGLTDSERDELTNRIIQLAREHYR